MMAFLQALVIAGSVFGLFYVLVRPQWTFVLVLAMFPLEQLLQSYIPALVANRQWVNIAVAVIAILAVALRAARRQPVASAYLNPVFVLVVAFYALYAVGLLYTIAPEKGRELFLSNFGYIVLYVLVTPLLIIDVFDLRRALVGLMVLGSIICVLIIVNPNSAYHTGRLVLDLGMMGTRSALGNPLAIAEMGGMVALIAALYVPQRVGQLVLLLRIAAFIAGFGLAIGSGSRGQVLAAAVAGIAFYPLSRRIGNPWQFIVSVVGFGALVFGLYVVFKLFIGYQNEARWDPYMMLADTMLRMDMVWELFSAWLESPAHWLFGLGPGAFSVVSSRPDADYVHNIAAEFLCEHGVVGFGLFLAMMALTARYGRSLWKLWAHDRSMRSVITVLLLICTYGLLLSLKQGNLSFPAPLYWWIILAKLSKHEQRMAEVELQHHDEAVAGAESGRRDAEGLILGY